MDAPPTLQSLEYSSYLDQHHIHSPGVQVLNRIWLEMQLNAHNTQEELRKINLMISGLYPHLSAEILYITYMT